MLVHFTLGDVENGEGHEHVVHAVELIPRRSDLPYRYVSNMVFLKEQEKSSPCSCQLVP